jgi:hypothetical protein
MDEELGISVILFWGNFLSVFQPKNSPNFWYQKKNPRIGQIGKRIEI